jgi:hypothetical protein
MTYDISTSNTPVFTYKSHKLDVARVVANQRYPFEENDFPRSEYDAAGMQELSRCGKHQSDRDSCNLQSRNRKDAG